MKYGGNLKNSQEEQGTGKDVKAADGRKEHQRYSKHEMGKCHVGGHYHEHHRGEKD